MALLECLCINIKGLPVGLTGRRSFRTRSTPPPPGQAQGYSGTEEGEKDESD